MSAPKDFDTPLKSPTRPGGESPTTVRPLDMSDDEDVQESNLHGDATTTTSSTQVPKHATVEDDEGAPPKPPRPLSPQQQAENTLKEAFPSIEASVIKAVLVASGGNVEPAFNALLGMSDPDAAREAPPPPQPPRPTNPRQGLSQVEADEQYARQLAEHYGGATGYGPRMSSRSGAQRQGYRGDGRGQPRPGEMYDDGHSFFDDDLPVIKENLRKGFLETQGKVNSWITQLKKKIDGDEEHENSYSYGEEGQSSQQPQRRGYPSGAGPIHYGDRKSGDNARRSGEYNRYDADPQVLGDDFAGIQLNDDGAALRNTRPLANPDLFKPTPTPPKSNDGRTVSFQTTTSDEDLYRRSPKPGVSTPTGKASKWQPLSTVEPNPVDADNDPFSLGDSEDEKESKDRVGGKEIKHDDTERLKKAAAEAMAEGIGGSSSGKKPEAAEISGTKDKVAEDKVAGKS